MELLAEDVLREGLPESALQRVIGLQQLQQVTPHKGTHWSPVTANREGRGGEGWIWSWLSPENRLPPPNPPEPVAQVLPLPQANGLLRSPAICILFQEITANSGAFMELVNPARAQHPDVPSGRERGTLWGKLWVDSQTQV